jgi:hypothetical protein
MNAGTLRLLLLLLVLVLYALAIVYLSRRFLSPTQFALWGLFALVVPILGPFIVFLMRPCGKSPPL